MARGPRHGRHERRPAARDVAARAHFGTTAGPQRTALDGSLTSRDATDGEGRYRRTRTLVLRRGDSVDFELSSSEMDTYAIVEGPRGETWEDDDGAGHGTDARVRFVAPEDGTYRFVATTYEPQTTGSFHVELTVTPGGRVDANNAPVEGDEGAEVDDQTAVQTPGEDDDGAEPGGANGDGGTQEPGGAGTGRTFGIFVGITDYAGDGENLPGSADDAVQLARAFERAGWMQRTNAVVLTDAQATPANIRTAFRQLAPRVGANDTFVFFYDGHGNTNVLGTRGGSLSSRELDRLLGSVHGRTLVALDSCHAGGFASIVRGRPNRWGLFSSRADELSSTAPEVNAGGWLAYYLREGVAGGVPRGADGSMRFGDLVNYVQTRYDRQGVSERQHLVATAGSGRMDVALGGRGAEPSAAPGTAVASNDRRPFRTPVYQVPSRPSSSARVPGPATSGARADAFGALLNTGVAMAGQLLGALTK